MNHVSAVLSRLPLDTASRAPSISVEALLDSGCTTQALISNKLIRDLDAEILELPKSLKLELADGSTVNRVSTYTLVQVQVGEHVDVVKALIADIAEEFILGIVWLNQHGVILNFKDHSLLFGTVCEDAGHYPWPGSGAEVQLSSISFAHSSLFSSSIDRAINSSLDGAPQGAGVNVGDALPKHSQPAFNPTGMLPGVAVNSLFKSPSKRDVLLDNLHSSLDSEYRIDPEASTYSEFITGYSITLSHEIAPSGIPLDPDGIPLELQKYRDVFIWDTTRPSRLPPQRPGIDMPIDLDPTKPLPPPQKTYRLSSENEKVRQEYVKQALEKGWIQKSTSPVAAGLFIVQQANGKRRPCVDFRPINAITMKDRYPIPVVDDMLELLEGCLLYTQLDMPDAYHQLRIRESDEWKTAFRTPEGLFEYKVVPFGLTNAPAVFQRFIRSLLAGELQGKAYDSFLDNIIIFYRPEPNEHKVTTQILAKHMKHVKRVLKIFRENNLMIRAKKCTFANTWIDFLGFNLKNSGITMQREKIAAVLDWLPPKSIKNVQSFLGFTNFYRRFIGNYATLAKPLTLLTRKSTEFKWSPEAQEAFNTLKEAFTSAPVLSQFNHTRETTLDTDASNFALGSVINQLQPDDNEWHPVFFRSRQLSEAETNYDTHDKELLAIIDALRVHRHNLLSLNEPFKIRCDHKNLKYFLTKKELTARQIHWAILLADYNFTIEFIAGKDNIPADLLSRKAEFRKGDNTTNQKAIFKTQGNQIQFNLPELKDVIPGGLPDFPFVMDVLDERTTYSEPLYPVKSHTIQLKNLGIDKERVFRSYHDSPLGGHLGFAKTLERLRRDYNWPGLTKELKRYLSNCQTCIRSKAKRHKPYGLLEPLPIPLQPWDEVGMDFITDLPLSKGFNTILVIKDRYSKMAHFIPTVSTITAKELAFICLDRWIKLHGLPTHITSDRDTLFVNNFWQELCKLLQITQRLSSAYHPQTDGSTEVVNQVLEQYIRAFGNYSQDDWVKWLPLCEFTYNDSVNTSTKMTPFWANYSYHPRSFNLAHLDESEKLRNDIVDLSGYLTELHSTLRDTLFETQNQFSIQANKRRIAAPVFEVGDSVYLNRRNIKTTRPSRKFDAKFLGPFKVLARIGNSAYRLELPHQWKIHDVFHVSLLEPGQQNPYPSQKQSQIPEPDIIEGQPEYELESILNHRVRRKHLEYLIHWMGMPDTLDTWETAELVKKHAQESIDDYWLSRNQVEPSTLSEMQDSLGDVHRNKRQRRDRKGDNVTRPGNTLRL